MNPIVPSAFGWSSGNTPLPRKVVATGMLSRSAEPDQRRGRAVARHARAREHHRVRRGSGRAHAAARCTWSSSGAGSTGIFTRSGRRVGLTLGDVLGKHDERGARPFGLRLLERLAHHLGRRVAHRHHVAPLRDRAEQRDEVDELVGFLVDAVQTGLRHERDQRMRVQLGVRDPEHQVDRAGTERRQTHTGLAGQRAVGVGHERRAAFVPSRDEPDRGVGERVDDVQVLFAGQPEDVLDALVLEALHDEPGDRVQGRRTHTPSVVDGAQLGARARLHPELPGELRVAHVLPQMFQRVQQRPRRRDRLVRPVRCAMEPSRRVRHRTVRPSPAGPGTPQPLRRTSSGNPPRRRPPLGTRPRGRGPATVRTLARLSQDLVLSIAWVTRTASPFVSSPAGRRLSSSAVHPSTALRSSSSESLRMSRAAATWGRPGST